MGGEKPEVDFFDGRIKTDGRPVSYPEYQAVCNPQDDQNRDQPLGKRHEKSDCRQEQDVDVMVAKKLTDSDHSK